MSEQTIGIVGAGGMGRGIARRLTTAGRSVLITDNKDDAAARVAQEASQGRPGTAHTASLEDVLSSDMVVLALWYPGTVDFATQHATALSGKIVIDIANPLSDTFTRLTVPPGTSAAEELARAVPGITVVKAFNTVPAPTLFDGTVGGTGLDTFVASDDDNAKKEVIALLDGSGLRALDAGSLDNAQLLERLCAFGIELGQRYQLGFNFGIKYLPATELTSSS
jgi:NADPH-dependent F420 reductase